MCMITPQTEKCSCFFELDTNRTNWRKVLEKKSRRLSNILFSLRLKKSTNVAELPSEIHLESKLKTLLSIITDHAFFLSSQDSGFQLMDSQFSEETDAAFPIHKLSQDIKLEGAFPNRSEHGVTKEGDQSVETLVRNNRSLMSFQSLAPPKCRLPSR